MNLTENDLLEGITEFVSEVLLEHLPDCTPLDVLYDVVSSEYDVNNDEVLRKRVRGALSKLKKDNLAENPSKGNWIAC